MQNFVPSIQDRLRTLGFPIFKRFSVPSISIKADGTPEFEVADIWHFQDIAETSGIALARNFVMFQTTEYKTYEDTEPVFRTALEVVGATANVGAVVRLGLRYVDIILPDGDQPLSTYLRPEAMGLSGADFNVATVSQESVFRGTTECEGTLVVRFRTADALNALPPDLQPATLRTSRTAPENTMCGVLDFDHFVERTTSFSIDAVMTSLGDLHDAIQRAFRASVTPTALKLWGAQDV